jgi:hypothetical protein
MKSLEEIQKALDLQTLQDKDPNLYDVLKELQDGQTAILAAIDVVAGRVTALENAS